MKQVIYKKVIGLSSGSIGVVLDKPYCKIFGIEKGDTVYITINKVKKNV